MNTKSKVNRISDACWELQETVWCGEFENAHESAIEDIINDIYLLIGHVEKIIDKEG